MLYIDEEQNISLTRGDTGVFTISLVDNNNVPYVPQAGDTLRFAMSKTYGSEILINKEIPIDTLILEIEPSDTKTLNFAPYVYDIQLTTNDGRVSTIIMGKFTITKEVE